MSRSSAHVTCLRQNWPPALEALAQPVREMIGIPGDDVLVMLERGHGFSLLAALEPMLDAERPIFIKVGGFSFRGSPVHRMTQGAIGDVLTLRQYLAALPDRILWSLEHLVRNETKAMLEVYDWHEPSPDHEYRLDVLAGQLVQVEGPDGGKIQPDSAGASVEAFWPQLRQTLHLDSVLADVALPAGPGREPPRLLELNPHPRDRATQA